MSSGSNITDLRLQPEFVIVSTSGLCTGFVNFICMIYLLVRLLTRWWVTEKSLPMGYTTIYGHTIEGVACKVVGGFSFFTVSTNVTLVGLLSLMTYLRVRRKYILDMGIYDYKLFVVLLTISLSLTLIGAQDYGPNKFWCYSSPTDPIRPLITIALIFLILFITLFCYVNTLMEVNIQQNMIRKFGSDNVTFSRVDIIVVRKIIAYILIFLLEWAPTVVYFITQMFQNNQEQPNIIISYLDVTEMVYNYESKNEELNINFHIELSSLLDIILENDELQKKNIEFEISYHIVFLISERNGYS
ncbi:2108_t:CDS:2 [Cetraspora pellucida]|uniref:2108_t:CDS:1 n=1 Tax=Cetraspora pellucida TaxID=1433469 RepID=A0ACA9LEW1_9GLOM|nr:2108_t:CDS:2 [Cetraspora pellucida]